MPFMPQPPGQPLGTPTLQPFQFTYNGLLMGPGTSFNINVDGVEGLISLPSIRSSDVDRPRDHGQFQGLDLLSGRDITIPLWVIAAPSYPNIQAALMALATAMVNALPAYPGANTELPLVFQLPNMDPMQFNVRVRKREIKIDVPYSTSQLSTPIIQFHATDPRAYDANLQSQTVSLPTPPGGLTFPLQFYSVPAIGNQVNVLSAADSDFETGLGTWVVDSLCTIAQSTAQAFTGTHSMAMTATGSTMAANTGSTTYAASPGQFWGATSKVRPNTTTQNGVFLTISFFNSSGTLLSSGNGASITEAASAWTGDGVDGALAPLGTAFVAIVQFVGSSLSNGDIHYIDHLTLYQDSPGLSFGNLGGGGIIQAANNGNFETRPVATVTGPCVNPRISNDTAGVFLNFALTLQPTDLLVVDFDAHSVLLNPSNTSPGASRRAALAGGSMWWSLPANSTTQVSFHSIDNVPTGATLNYQWRSAWLL